MSDLIVRPRNESVRHWSNQEFHRLLEKLPVAAYTCDADGLITYFNSAAVEAWGRAPRLNDPADRFCGSFRLFDSNGTPIRHDDCWMARALKHGREYNAHEIVVEQPGGRLRTVLAHANPFFDEHGKLLGAVNVLVDVTDRHRAEQERIRDNQTLTTLVASAPLAIVVIDPDPPIVRLWNPAAELLFGWTAQEVMGQRIPVVPDEHRGECASYRAMVSAGGSFQSAETARLRKDGTLIDVSISASPLRDDAGRVTGIMLLFNDVTERKKADRTQALLAAIVNSSQDAIVSKTLQGRITSWNTGAQRLFGYTPEETIGQSITMLIPPERQYEEDMILARLSRGEVIDHYETVRMTKDGRYLDISLTISPIRDSSGRIIGASKVARDITAQKRAEAALIEADRRKTEFLAVLAHELRNPLAPIRAGLEILRLSEGRGQTAERAMVTMSRQLGHMVRLIDDLLDVSRITNGKIELRKKRIDLAVAVRDAIEASAPSIQSAGHEFTVSFPPEPIWVDADQTRLAQIFTNLLNNSARYTEAGGRISLRVERHKGVATVTVADNGVGIPAEVLPHIFDLFTQANRRLEKAKGGLGIGLSLVRGLVELHGGTVEARSDGPGRGSEFVVRLPIHVEHGTRTTESDQPGPTAKSAPRRLKLLVADDNEDAAESLALLLGLLGHETRTARDGLEAAELAAAFRPDVALLDLGMPRLNGHDACRRIRSEPWGKDMILVALTGWGQDEDRDRSKEAGFDHHLVKPVLSSALEPILTRVRR